MTRSVPPTDRVLVDGIPHLLAGRRLGATVLDGDTSRTRFELWAPAASQVAVVLDGQPARPAAPLDQLDDGTWIGELDGVGHGDRYRISLDGGEPLPDPASAWQPTGVHGPSAVVDTARWGAAAHGPAPFGWSDTDWRGRDLVGTVLYELHVGTFTPEGTFDAAAAHLPRLAELGVTTIELMPVNATPGRRNWGYDGVFPYAVHEPYGGPVGLARFVDAAHAHGLAVIADVVHNHLGPEGNVLGRFGPYFTDTYRTPWGDAVNVMGPGSDGFRRYVLEHLWRWVTEYHLDGYRLDAVHAVIDTTATPLWEQAATVVHAAGRSVGRRTVVIAETADNDPRYLRPVDAGGYGHDAVWNDDLHHSLRVAVTGERRAYYADYLGTAEELADLLEHRWSFRGRYSTFRGRHHGRPVDDRAPHRFVVYSQNHDQIGNRAAGERPDHHVSAADRRLMAAVVLLSPFTPMLFMGEEYGEVAPFPFFVDHSDPYLLDATRRGRREEFASAGWGDDVPDPADPATFRSAVLDPTLRDREPHRSLGAMYTELLRLRRDVPAIAADDARRRVRRTDDLVELCSERPGDTAARVLINLGRAPATTEGARRRVVFHSGDPAWGGSDAVGPADGIVEELVIPARTVVLVVDE